MPEDQTPQLISLLLPTRGRPRLCERFFQSVLDHTSMPSRVEIILYIDDDDIESHRLDARNLRIKKLIGPRLSMGGYNTACLEASSGDIIMLANDDMVIRTDGWDTRVRALDDSVEDGIYLGYGNDLLKGGRLCTFPILSRRACRVLVEPFPIAYRGAFIDYHLLDTFKRVQKAGFDRIRYLPDVVFEHLHYRSGKASFDETYRTRDRFADDRIFLGLAGMRRSQAELLIQAIRGADPEEGMPSTRSATDLLQDTTPLLSLIYRGVTGDSGLPWDWRMRLTAWLLARLVYSGWFDSRLPMGQRTSGLGK